MRESVVSMIIPCYNGEQYLPDFLRSLAAQDYPCVEILFIDDGSTDHTGDIYRQWEKDLPEHWKSRYVMQEHSGQAAAVANALQYVTGDLLTWSDADDLMLPVAIGEKARFLQRHPEYDMVRNDFYYFREGFPLVPGYGTNKSKSDDIFDGIFDSTIPCMAGTYMMRTSLLFSCYPDKKIPLSAEGQNLQLLMPPASRSKCAFIDKPLMQYRIHPDSHSRRPRSTTQQFSRAEEFMKLRKALLPYCICDRELYTKRAEMIFAEQKKAIVSAVLADRKKQQEAALPEKMQAPRMPLGENTKDQCTGCEACKSVCKQNAITMTADAEGFLYPEIDLAFCINCEKCREICPKNDNTVKSVYGIAFRHTDDEVRSKSASGGAFFTIVEKFWTDHPDGVVFGAAFDNTLAVSHIGIAIEQGIVCLHSSKYVQSSSLSEAYATIGKLLDDGRNVLFSGTPCQCAAVRNIFGFHDHLLIVDLVCNGVASPSVFRKYLDILANGKKAVSYGFRNKRFEKGRGMFCSFTDGSIVEQPHGKDLFCKLYMTNMISRPSCYHCKFTTPDRSSDMTLGDFHGLEEMDPAFFKDGTSLVIPHTAKGKRYADGLRRAGEYKEYPIEKCLQPRLKNPPQQPLLRKLILKDFLAMSTDNFLKKYKMI